MKIGDPVRLKLSYYTGVILDIYPSSSEAMSTYCEVVGNESKIKELFNQDNLVVYEPCSGCFFGCPVCECGLV